MNAIRSDIEDIDNQIEKIRGKIKSASKDDTLLKDNQVGSISLDALEKRIDQALSIAEDVVKKAQQQKK